MNSKQLSRNANDFKNASSQPQQIKISIKIPWKDIPKNVQKIILYGDKENIINKLIKNGEYDKVRIYYSENLENYSAWEGVKNSQAEFNLDTVERTSYWVYYRTGTFKGKVFNYNNPSDSVIIENGSFNFEAYKLY